MNKLNLFVRYFLLAIPSVLLSSCSLFTGDESVVYATPVRNIEIYLSSYPEFTYKKKNSKGISVYINSKVDPHLLAGGAVLGRLDNYTVILPASEPSLDKLYAAYVKKAFDEAGFNVVDEPRKTSIIVDVVPGELNISFSNSAKTGVKVKNELYLKLEQGTTDYSYRIVCRFGGSEFATEPLALHFHYKDNDDEKYLSSRLFFSA